MALILSLSKDEGGPTEPDRADRSPARRSERSVGFRAYFLPLVTMNGDTEAGAAFLSAFGLRTSLLVFF